MDAKICDRCGNYFVIKTITDKKDPICNIFTTKIPNDVYNFTGRNIDVCPECAADFERWLNEKKTEVLEK